MPRHDDEEEEKPAGNRKQPGENARPLTRESSGTSSIGMPHRRPTEDDRPMSEEPFDASIQSGAPTQDDWGNPEQANVRDEREREEGRFMHQMDREAPGYAYEPREPETSIGARTERSPAIPRDRTTTRPREPEAQSGRGGPRVTGDVAENEEEADASPASDEPKTT